MTEEGVASTPSMKVSTGSCAQRGSQCPKPCLTGTALWFRRWWCGVTRSPVFSGNAAVRLSLTLTLGQGRAYRSEQAIPRSRIR
jgi:hypothetical protein